MQETAVRRPATAQARELTAGVRRILLATDLSPASDAATSQALELAHDLRADLVILSVIEPAPRPRQDSDPRAGRVRRNVPGATRRTARDVGPFGPSTGALAPRD
jgi:nucleotide-binding universal stress UspA family protein